MATRLLHRPLAAAGAAAMGLVALYFGGAALLLRFDADGRCSDLREYWLQRS